MSAPRRLPVLDIEVSKVRLPDDCTRGFSGMRVQQRLSQPTLCELTFANIEEGVVSEAFPLGAAFSVLERSVTTPLFEGRVTAVEYSYDVGRTGTVTVRGYDDLFILRNRQSVRTHVGLTVAELARELVSDLGLNVEADTPGPVWQRLLQTGTDLDLLDDVAARCGLYTVLTGQTLKLLTLAGAGELIKLGLNDNLLEARLEANSNGVCRKVSANGWDPWRGIECVGDASTPRVGRVVDLQAPASLIGGKDERTQLGAALQDEEHASASAQAELDVRTTHEIGFWGIAMGNPQLRPGARVHVSGVAGPLCGEYVLASAKHTLDADRGYMSEVSTVLPPPRPKVMGTTMTLGQVSQIDDPDKLGRVQVTLPAYANLETDWLMVLAPGAGKGKGLVAQPDIGDLVLLLLDKGDLAQAIVLGGVYGEAGLPEGQDVLGEGASFSFMSPGGQRIRLNDAANSVRLENSGGSLVEFTPEAMTLSSKTPLTIEAPGQKILIRAKFVDFERI